MNRNVGFYFCYLSYVVDLNCAIGRPVRVGDAVRVEPESRDLRYRPGLQDFFVGPLEQVDTLKK